MKEPMQTMSSRVEGFFFSFLRVQKHLFPISFHAGFVYKQWPLVILPIHQDFLISAKIEKKIKQVSKLGILFT
jgi:hypothetical protein